eukprot:COSAG02_NODE_4586_length_5189_cov_5.995678_3_plen_64_part_00
MDISLCGFVGVVGLSRPVDNHSSCMVIGTHCRMQPAVSTELYTCTVCVNDSAFLYKHIVQCGP